MITVLFLALIGLQDARPVTKDALARQLLDAAFDQAPGAQPEVAATALRRIGETYAGLDRQRSLEALTRAFEVSAGIPPSAAIPRERVQSEVARTAMSLDLAAGLKMLRSIGPIPPGDYDPRQPAINAAVTQFLEKKRFDDAIDLINSVGAVGQYPFTAAGLIFEKLPKNDGRRLSLVGYALSAYTLRPAEDFGKFLINHWQEIPRSTLDAAVRQIAETILAEKDDGLILTLGTGRGPLVIRGRQNVELFDMMHVIRAVDRKYADQILESHPELKAALSRFPNGLSDMSGMDSVSRGYSEEGQAQDAISSSQTAAIVSEALKLIPDDVSAENAPKVFQKLLDLAKSAPDAISRAELLTLLAIQATSEAPEFPRIALSEGMDVLKKEVKDPARRYPAWNNIAEAAHEAKDDKLAWEAVGCAMDDAAEIYKLDTASWTDGDNPNTGLRDEWPSTNAYRRTIITAVKVFGVDAEPLLARIEDRDLNLFARVEMAQALLGREHGNWATSLRPAKK